MINKPLDNCEGWLNQLQALRALAFLGIFISHSGLSSQLGAWGVSIFFVLSGFLTAYNSNNKKLPSGIKESLKYSINKILKLYPLHIVMMLSAIPYEIQRSGQLGYRSNIGLWVLNTLSSVSLTESWFPTWTVFGSYNGVAWFLSALLFLYFCFPGVISRIRNRNRNQIIAIMIIIYAVMFLFTWLTRNIVFGGTYPDNCYWSAYTFPVLRLGDFVIGCCAGLLFKLKSDYKSTKETVVFSLLEIISFELVGLSMCYYSSQSNILGQNWFRYTMLWLPTSVLLVWLFAVNKGLISKLLNNKLFVWVGNISSITFLTHYMVIFYIEYLFNHTLHDPLQAIVENVGFFDTELFFRIIRCIFALIITIMLSVFWKRVSKKVFKHRKSFY